MKKCLKCNKNLNEESFGVLKSSPDGRNSTCKECRKVYAKKYYTNNKEYIHKYERDHIDNRKKNERKRYKSHVPFIKYKNNLTVDEEPIKSTDGYLEVKCYHCKKYFKPDFGAVTRRVSSLKSNSKGESHLYCSDKCKNECIVYDRVSLPRNKTRSKIRCNQRTNKLALINAQIDKYKYTFCEKCGTKTEKLELHHNKTVSKYPEDVDDMSHQLLVCSKCHTHDRC